MSETFFIALMTGVFILAAGIVGVVFAQKYAAE
jgi:uncharacterized membrane protein